MNKLILIGGVLAGGKSAYSLILKEKYNLSVINKDRLKEILGDTIVFNDRNGNKKLSVISFNLMCYLLESINGNIILESNFKDYELKELKRLSNKLNLDVLSIIFDGDNNILHKRFIKRLNENRHYVHKTQDFSDINDFIAVLDELRNAKYFGEIIKINCDNFNYQNDDKIFNKIKEFLSKKGEI